MAHDVLVTVTAESETAGFKIPHDALEALEETADAEAMRDALKEEAAKWLLVRAIARGTGQYNQAIATITNTD